MKKKLITIAIILYAFFAIRGCMGCNESQNKAKRSLDCVYIRCSDTQLEITTTETITNVHFWLNGNFTYEVSSIEPGTYTVGLKRFTDKSGNRFDPFIRDVKRVSVFCNEGSTSFSK